MTSSGLSTVPTSSVQNSVSTYLQPYVNNMLSSGQALANAPMPDYTGQLTAGSSDLQNQAWGGLANLALPSSLTNAGTNLNNIANQEQNLSYTPTTFTDTYSAPSAYSSTPLSNQYSAPTAYQGINATNQYVAPTTGYTPTNVTTGQFDANAAQQYMNPYIQQSLNPQLQALQRQQQINQQGDLAKLTQAGAYGGSRQAVLEGQNNYNLLAQQANLIGTGYNQAYNQAGQQFTADQARALQAQQANVQQAQYGSTLAQQNAAANAQYGSTAQQANIQQAQFGATQGMTAAQLQAQYGLSADQANQLASQYGYTQQMTQAQQQAQALQAQQNATQAANQFGATYGLQGLQAATTAQQAAANAGAQQAQYGLQNLQALSTAGGQQQALQQAADTAQYNQYLAQLQYPQTMLTLQKSIMAGLPQGTSTTYNATPSTFQNAMSAAGGVAALTKNLTDMGLTPAAIKAYFSSNGYDANNPGSVSGGNPINSVDNGNGTNTVTEDSGASYQTDANGIMIPGSWVDAQNQASLDAYNANPSPIYATTNV